jgi:hypothetical protein
VTTVAFLLPKMPPFTLKPYSTVIPAKNWPVSGEIGQAFLFPFFKKKKKKNLHTAVAPRRGVQIGDEAQFKKSVDKQFEALDLNKDGVLSCKELWKAFELMRLIETHFGIDVATLPEQLTQLYDSIFEGSTTTRAGRWTARSSRRSSSGTVDREEFKEEFKWDGGPRGVRGVLRSSPYLASFSPFRTRLLLFSLVQRERRRQRSATWEVRQSAASEREEDEDFKKETKTGF